MALLAVETANGFNGRPRAAGRTMPVECMSGKPAFLAAIAWFAAHLLTNHVSQHPKAFFRPPFFRFVEMVVHQLMEDAHGRVAFQLAVAPAFSSTQRRRKTSHSSVLPSCW